MWTTTLCRPRYDKAHSTSFYSQEKTHYQKMRGMGQGSQLPS